MNIKTVFLVFSLLAVILAGCGKEQEKKENMAGSTSLGQKQENTPEKQMSEIKDVLSSGIVVDAKIEVPEALGAGNLPIYSAFTRKMEFKKFNDLFMKDKKIVEKNDGISEGNMGNEVYKYYIAEDGSTLTYNGGIFLNYSDARFTDIYVDYEIEDKEREKLERDFSFETRKDAAKKIENVFQELGVEVYSEYQCYALDYKWIQEKNPYLDEEKSINWNDEMNCYLFRYLGAVDQMPMTNQIRDVQGQFTPATNIFVAYSKDGIVQIEIANLFQIEGKKEEIDIISIDDMLSLLDNKYNSIILEGKYNVTKIRFEYVPLNTPEDGIYHLVPAWRVYIEHEIETPDKSKSNNLETVVIPTQVLFNAADGTEILTGVDI